MLNFFVQKRAGGDGFMIEFQNVSKIFKTKECEVKALENVSLTIEDAIYMELLVSQEPANLL